MSFQLTQKALHVKGLTNGEKLTLAMLADAYFEDTGKCEMSLRHIAKLLDSDHSIE